CAKNQHVATPRHRFGAAVSGPVHLPFGKARMWHALTPEWTGLKERVDGVGLEKVGTGGPFVVHTGRELEREQGQDDAPQSARNESKTHGAPSELEVNKGLGFPTLKQDEVEHER